MNLNTTHKKAGIVSVLVMFTVFMLCAIAPVSAATLPSVGDNAPSLTVKNVQITPSVFMPGDTGTIAVTLVNNGDNGASVSKAVLHDTTGFESSMTDYYSDFGTIAPGNSVTVVMPVKAGMNTGTYYPTFYVDFNRGMGYLKQPVALTIDDAGLDVVLTSVPDAISATGSETIKINLANRMNTNLTSVSVTAEGNGVTCKEGSVFVGTIGAGRSAPATLTVKTDNADDVKLVISYNNGNNKHTKTVSLKAGAPFTKASDLPELTVANIKITDGETYKTLKADVNNLGFTTAKSLKIDTKEGSDIGPYPSYPVGNLDADDLAGFEISFDKSINDQLTLVFTYKNPSGDLTTEYYPISVANHIVEQPKDYTGIIALIVLGAVVVIIVVLCVRKSSKNKKGKKN